MRRRDAVALAVLAAVFAAGWFAVGGSRDVPSTDDWLYAASVETLVSTGRLRVAEFSAVYPISQILWGALFCWPFGFSFGALRLSTVCLAWAGCAATYGIARRTGCSEQSSLFVALAVAVDPVFFSLSYSFMTDVPFVALSVVSLYFTASAVEEGGRRWWLGAAFAVAAFLVRPLAIALPVSSACAAGWRRDRRAVWPVVVSAVAMGALWVLLPHVVGALDWRTSRLESLKWWSTVPMRSYASWNLHLAFEIAFCAAPVAIAAAFGRGRAAVVTLVVAAAIGAALLLAGSGLPFPLPEAGTWSLRDLGARALLAGDASPSGAILRLVPVLSVAAVMAVAALLVGAARTLTTMRAAGVAFVVFGAAQWLLINALWLYNDRYYLVLLPVVVYVAAQAGPIRPAIAAVLIAIWLGVSVSGTRDLLAFNEACAAAVARLEASGVPAADIDAGYVLNGWRLYNHPERLGPGRDRRYDVPFVTGGGPAPYALTNQPEPGADIVETVRLPAAWWESTRQFYVVHRRGVPSLVHVVQSRGPTPAPDALGAVALAHSQRSTRPAAHLCG